MVRICLWMVNKLSFVLSLLSNAAVPKNVNLIEEIEDLAS